MRPAFSSAFLIAALLAAGPVSAQQSGWVDPPAKGSANTADGVATPQAKSAERPDSEPAETARVQRPDAPRAAEAPVRRPKAAEVRRERRMTAGRAARPTFSPEEMQPLPSDRADTAQRLTAAYLGVVSAPGAAMVAAAPRFYGERVRFHGRLMSLSALMSEKSRFVRRWPERRYAPQGAMRTNCEGETCTVRTAFDFRAENPDRGARSQGAGELTLTIGFGEGRPRILSESSRVLRYGGPVLGQADRPARGA